MRQHTAFPARKIAMGNTHLTQDERYHIQYLSRYCTIAEIAKQLNRHKSTISREIKRHCIQRQQYSADKAQRQSRLTKQHRRKPYKLDSQCKPPPTFALCCSNFCTLGSAKVSPAFALYRMMRNKKSDATVAFYFTNYIRPILHWFYQFYFFRPYKPIQVE